MAVLSGHQRGLVVVVPPAEASARPDQAAERADGPTPGAPVESGVRVLIARRHEVDVGAVVDRLRDLRHRIVLGPTLAACEEKRSGGWIRHPGRPRWRCRRARTASVIGGVAI